jgi:hypothetical protein
MFIRRFALLGVLLSAVAGCLFDTTEPKGTDLYLLHRIGSRPLPTFLESSAPNQLILADTLVVPLGLMRDGKTFVVRRVQVGQNPPEPVYRFAGEYRAAVTASALVIDNCPIGALCAASLVYAPFTLTIVGDSLVEALPSGATSEPRVYGLVRQSGRAR